MKDNPILETLKFQKQQQARERPCLGTVESYSDGMAVVLEDGAAGSGGVRSVCIRGCEPKAGDRVVFLRVNNSAKVILGIVERR